MDRKENNALEEFDWVAARAEWTPSKMFAQLTREIAEDVDKRRALRLPGQVHFQHHTDEACAVSVSNFYDPSDFKGVTFTQKADGVEVSDLRTAEVQHKALIRISPSGHFRLEVDKGELTLWQFRMLALGPVLFAS